MALYMIFHVVPEAHLDFLAAHGETVGAYLNGHPPEIRRTFMDKLFGRTPAVDVPDGWPNAELEGAVPEVNHRQVEYFHYLLNGSHDKVSHAGCVFQTWFAPHFDSVALKIDGENFAFRYDDVVRLHELVKRVSEAELVNRYREALNETEVTPEDIEFLTNAFDTIAAVCEQAIESKSGLMWVLG